MGHEITAGQPVEVRNQEMTIQIITVQNTKKRGGNYLGFDIVLIASFSSSGQRYRFRQSQERQLRSFLKRGIFW